MASCLPLFFTLQSIILLHILTHTQNLHNTSTRRSVISFLMHQLTEDDEDYEDELSNLSASWQLPVQPPTSSTQTQQQRKRLYIPISDQFGASRLAFTRPGGGYHWSILLWDIVTSYKKVDDDGFSAVVDVGFHHFDSSKGLNELAAKAVAEKLQKVLHTSMSKDVRITDVVEVVECKTPQQRNGYDCGVLALGFAEALSVCDDHGFAKEHYESMLQSHFETNGGHENFALGLRKKIGDDIRQLARE